MLGVLALACLASSRGAAQGQAGWRLAIDVNGRKSTEWTPIALPDTILLTVSPQDAQGNALPLVGYEVQVEDQGVVGLVGSTIEARRGVTRLVPRKRGRTTIQVRASGLKQWIQVEVTERALAVSLREAPPPGGGEPFATATAGARVSYAHYEYTFNQQTAIKGNGGVVAEAYVGLQYWYGVTMVGGVGFGILGADSLNTPVNAQLLELFFRMDYAFLSGKVVRPVLSVGGGAYRIRTGGDGSGIWNTSLSWMLGTGADVVLGPKMTGELRIATNFQEELNSGHQNGHVGNLLVIGAGVRVQF
jgi:hypothetical protein